jgi:AcrR family transcriptional regulator
MRVTKERHDEIRRSLIQASVELFTEKGFSGATMREISERAGVSAGTIYNYFPNKEKIFYAYFDLKQDELRDSLAGIGGFGEFTLKEKLQTLIETLLDIYSEDREFVASSYKILLDSPMSSFTELVPFKDKFTQLVRELFAAAVDAQTIPAQPFESFLANVFWDYTNLMVLYWLRDDSDGFSNTTRLIDLSLDIFVDIITTGVVHKAANVLSFLFKSHIYGNIDKVSHIIGVLTKLPDPFASRNGSTPESDRG